MGWLRAHTVTLEACTQAHVELWLAGPPSRVYARDFIRWACRRRLAQDIDIIRRADSVPGRSVHADRLLATARRFAVDDALPLVDRVAGLPLLCYGQTLARIARLQRNDVVVGVSASIRFGATGIVLADPVDRLVRQLLSCPQGRATTAAPDTTVWLFPAAHRGGPSRLTLSVCASAPMGSTRGRPATPSCWTSPPNSLLPSSPTSLAWPRPPRVGGSATPEGTGPVMWQHVEGIERLPQVASRLPVLLRLHVAAGEDKRAAELLCWTRHLRHDDGSYFTGMVHPSGPTSPAGIGPPTAPPRWCWPPTPSPAAGLLPGCSGPRGSPAWDSSEPPSWWSPTRCEVLLRLAAAELVEASLQIVEVHDRDELDVSVQALEERLRDHRYL